MDANQLLRLHLENAAVRCAVPYLDFVRSRGANDFFKDAADRKQESRDLAAQFLQDLIIGDKERMDGVVCIAVIGFLDESVGKPPSDPTMERRCKDLATLIGDQAAGLSQYRRWVQSWYP
jgi:hypothetical protein